MRAGRSCGLRGGSSARSHENRTRAPSRQKPEPRPPGRTAQAWATHRRVRTCRSHPMDWPPARSASMTASADRRSHSGFVCSEGLCLARHPSGVVVAHALDAQAAMDACAIAGVIVIDDATAKNVCRWQDVLVVTSRDLALRGSAAITLPDRRTTPDRPDVSSGDEAMAEFAISQPFRPWHEQRRFSRAARGLPPYQRKPASPSPAGAEPNPQASPTPPRPSQSRQISNAGSARRACPAP